MKSIEWTGQELVLLDQTQLPATVEYVHCEDWRVVAEAIKALRVRGAPAIGVAAGYGLILAAREVEAFQGSDEEKFSRFFEFAEALRNTRPTAINLMWAVDRVVALVKGESSFATVVKLVEVEARRIDEEDLGLNGSISRHGADLFAGKEGIRILTHCNAGALATAGIGTALGVVRELHHRGQLTMVYADETRPLLQGSRLTAFELHEEGIPVTLQTDNMAAYAMQQGLIDAVIVGADRITLEGDVANKIGTYGLAVLAKAHGIPFYVAAPYSTFDFTMEKGTDIPIEMRDPQEVLSFQGVPSAPQGVQVLNPAFDVTPHEYIAGIITEAGVLAPDFKESIAALRAQYVKG